MISSSSVQHASYLQSELWKIKDSYCDTRVVLSDGSLQQNRLLLGLLERFLQRLPEFCATDVDAAVIFPDLSCQQFLQLLREKLFTRPVCSTFAAPSDFSATVDSIESVNVTKDFEIVMPELLKSDPNLDDNGKIESSEVTDIHESQHQDSFFHEKSNSEFGALVGPDKKMKHFQCPVCEKWFGRKSNLTAHRRHHDGTALRYPCPVPSCGKLFSHPSEVKQHSSVHTGKPVILSQSFHFLILQFIWTHFNYWQ